MMYQLNHTLIRQNLWGILELFCGTVEFEPQNFCGFRKEKLAL